MLSAGDTRVCIARLGTRMHPGTSRPVVIRMRCGTHEAASGRASGFAKHMCVTACRISPVSKVKELLGAPDGLKRAQKCRMSIASWTVWALDGPDFEAPYAGRLYIASVHLTVPMGHLFRAR